MNTTLYKSNKRLKSLETRLKPQKDTLLYQIINRCGLVVFSAELPLFVNGKNYFNKGKRSK